MASPQIAFVPGTQVARARHGEGPLSGLTFAAKDLFAIRGHTSSFGAPDWRRTHEPAASYAPVVAGLLEAGADLVGVTILDELAFSLAGINDAYGTPENPRAEGRLCGGSSCGSAAAVAAALCDFALGTDTAGSVRVPSAFCGLFGIRATHGALSADGVLPLAPSFDAVGYMARDAHTFGAVGKVLFGVAASQSIERVLVAEDAFALNDAGVPEMLRDQLDGALAKLGVRAEAIDIAPEGFATLAAAYNRLRMREIWQTLGGWYTEAAPELSAAIDARMQQCREVADPSQEDLALRARIRARIDELCAPGVLLFVPPAPGIAPRLDASEQELATFRARTVELASLSALSGAPQLVVPARELDGAPLALSFLARSGSDAWLSQLAPRFERAT
ncbi:MAG TPA: amidase [Polyangiales bacterium]|nr:amidase [Polyangiales bacterium]